MKINALYLLSLTDFFFIFLKVWQFVLLLQLKKLNHNDHNNHNNLNFRDFSSISKKIFNGQ